MRLLDLFCGAGGAARGYQRAGFYVVGVDHKPQPRYVGDEFVQGDALEYVIEHGAEYDVIHASPPCQRYSQATPVDCKEKHPDLIGVVQEALRIIGKPYIIENVSGARYLLPRALMLCGTMFGLNIWRHRYFETWPLFLMSPASCNHNSIPVLITGTTRRKGYPRKDPPVALRREAMETPWMTISNMDEAIPPAYTEFIGRRIVETS